MYLELENIYKNFQIGKQEQLNVLNDINLSVKKGEFVSLLGPSGCGKSTLLYLIAGIEQASSGEIKLENKIINKPGPDRVVVFQSDGLFPWMTVLENVMYGLKIKKMPQDLAYKKAEETLKMVHLGKYLNSYPHQLSGGMKQRVAIARALVMEPDILLMDEPFAALDEQTRMVLHQELLSIWRKTAVTIIFVTHNIREAALLSEKIVVMATRPGSIKKVFEPENYTDGITPNDVTLKLEKDIMNVLQEEIEKVLKEEMGDDYSFKTNSIHRDTSGDMGSHI